jgi:hypothetical protein
VRGFEIGGNFLRDVKDFLVSHQIRHNVYSLHAATAELLHGLGMLAKLTCKVTKKIANRPHFGVIKSFLAT